LNKKLPSSLDLISFFSSDPSLPEPSDDVAMALSTITTAAEVAEAAAVATAADERARAAVAEMAATTAEAVAAAVLRARHPSYCPARVGGPCCMPCHMLGEPCRFHTRGDNKLLKKIFVSLSCPFFKCNNLRNSV